MQFVSWCISKAFELKTKGPVLSQRRSCAIQLPSGVGFTWLYYALLYIEFCNGLLRNESFKLL